MNYQKVYMNHIHSSSMLCQLAQMWRSQLLCDALICTGNVVTKVLYCYKCFSCIQSWRKSSVCHENITLWSSSNLFILSDRRVPICNRNSYTCIRKCKHSFSRKSTCKTWNIKTEIYYWAQKYVDFHTPQISKIVCV